MKVIIIGGGVAGLSAGINALLKGYSTVIYEKNDCAGGCCGGWVRNGYYIDNCIHWLTGTNFQTRNFKLWKRLGALDEVSNLYQPDYFYKSIIDVSDKTKEISFSTDLERLRKNLYALSLEDKREIDKMINAIYYLETLHKRTPLIKNIKGKLSLLSVYRYYHNKSLDDLSKKFKSPYFKTILTDYFPGNYSSLAFLCAYATFASGNGKVNFKGSKDFANRMLKKYLKLGGEIEYNKEVVSINIDITNKYDEVQNIITKDTRSTEIQADKADFYIYTGDYYHLFKNLIPYEYMSDEMNSLFSNETNNPVFSSFHIAFLVDKKNNPFHDVLVFPVSLSFNNHLIDRIAIRDTSYLYQNDDNVVVQVFLKQSMEDINYWFNLPKDEYLQEKDKLSSLIIDEINRRYNNVVIDVIDSWTPKTYYEYFYSYKGGYMGFIFKKKQTVIYKDSLKKDISNLKIASYWTEFIGGLPIAARLGQKAVKSL